MITSSRKNKYRIRSTILLIATLFATPWAISAAPLKAGDIFPALGDFKLEGKLPDSLKGKVVLVDFWASWCAPCSASFPALNEIHNHYASQGLVIIGINVDINRGDMKAFLNKKLARFAILRDSDQKLVGSLAIETMPTSFLIDAEGRVRFIHAGYHGAETKKKYVEEIESLLNIKPVNP